MRRVLAAAVVALAAPATAYAQPPTPPSAPSAPSAPSVPSAPSAPSAPTAPSAPASVSPPAAPSVPSLPQVAAAPAASADLGVTGVAASAGVSPGERIAYTFTVTNHGPNSTPGSVLTVQLPAGSRLVSATPSSGTCSGSSTVTCTFGALASGKSVTITVVVEAVDAGELVLNAGVGFTGADPNMANQRLALRTSVSAPPQAQPPASTQPAGPVGPRPKGVPKRIPRWAWDLAKWYDSGKVGKRPAKAPRKIPQWYWQWRAWRLGRG